VDPVLCKSSVLQQRLASLPPGAALLYINHSQKY